MKHLHIADTFDFAPSSRTYTDNGFLRVSGKAARTGVYQYIASELELKDRAPNDIVNVYRPADEVFDSNSLQSYSNVDVTNDHPSKLVNSDTYKSTSVGHVISATQDGDFVNVDMIIKDAQAIKDVESGKAQLSPGYTAVYVAEKGNAPCGTAYDFKQTGLDINHVAIVKRGRGGEQVRINDNHGVKTMNKLTLDSGRSVDIEDDAIAALVSDSFERLTKIAKDAETAKSKAEAEKDAMAEKLEAEKEKTTDAAITQRVQAVSMLLGDARKVVGDTFTCDSVDPVTIQRVVLTEKRPTIDWVAKSDAYVEAAFDMVVSDSAEPKQHIDQHAQFSKDAANVVAPVEVKDSAYSKYKKDQAAAWQEK